MNYTLSFHNPLTHIISIKLTIVNIDKDEVFLAIPTWRPGRYEAANFSKNVRNFKIEDQNGDPVNYKKTTHSSWGVDTSATKSIIVSYEYFAFKMDAGNSWFDESLIYINFVNCLIYDKEQQHKNCEIFLDLPANYKVSCGISIENNVLKAKSYFDIVDSPLMASADLEHHEFEISNYKFHIWINGRHSLNIDSLLSDFRKFSEVQILLMEGFPEETFHFQILVQPYKFYHGVEHHDSTVICIGPGENLHTKELYGQLLGVSSHELFHAWNIIKIRPKELLPYCFDKEVNFATGYVAEGFTTYYGDLFLVRSGVFNQEDYFNELNTLFRRHFSNFGRLSYSVMDSSMDLWVDGYTTGIPHRKSSIYVEGAVTALTLDLMIRKKTNDKKSLDDLMKTLWENYGKKDIGYTHEDIIHNCEMIYGDNLTEFFKDHVEGTMSKEIVLNQVLDHVGCTLEEIDADQNLEKYFGVKVINQNGHLIISAIAPNSVGELNFSIDDEILSVNGHAPSIELTNEIGLNTYTFSLKRGNSNVLVALEPGSATYYKQYVIQKIANPTEGQKKSLQKWLG